MPNLAPKPQSSPMQILVRGLATGFVATQVLDLVSMALYENMGEEDRLQEDRARNGHQAYEEMAKNLAKLAGLELTEDQIKYWGWKVHRSFGFAGGVQYIAAREKFPAIASAWGVPFGVGFFLFADQGLIYFTKSTPGPQNFNWKAHARGFVAHVAYGFAAEMVAKTFDKVAEYEAGTGWSLEEDKGNPRLQAAARTTPMRSRESRGSRASEMNAGM